jgi:hypothetical protein
MSADSEPGERYWSVIEPVWDTIDIYGSPALFLKQFRAVTLVAGHLFAAHWCQSEVCNGGFHQFFFNSTGVLAPEARAGYLAIGLSEWAQMLDEAMSFFGVPYPREHDKRITKLPRGPGKRQEWDPFYALDERFYSWLHGEKDRWERAADAFAELHLN